MHVIQPVVTFRKETLDHELRITPDLRRYVSSRSQYFVLAALCGSRGAMTEYWNDPELTQATIRDGWVATGDLGYRDVDGYVWHTGRLKQIFIIEGDNVTARRRGREKGAVKPPGC